MGIERPLTITAREISRRGNGPRLDIQLLIDALDKSVD